MPRGIDRYDEALRQGRLWTPANLRSTSKLKLWCDALDTGTIATASGVVSQWSDKSGFNNHFIQSTAGNRMSYDPAYLAGKPALLNPSDRVMNTNSGAGLTMAFPYFLLLVFSTKSIQGTGYIRYANVGYAGDQYGFLGMNAGNFATFVGTGGAWNDVAANSPTTAVTAGRIHVAAMHNKGSGAGNLIPYYDGVIHTAKSGSAASVNDQWIGSPYGVSGTVDQDFIGAFHEVIICLGTSPTSREIDLLLGAAHWKWNAVEQLAGSHPFKNRPPLIGD